MVGQKLLIEQMTAQVHDGTFPRFSIVSGLKYSGKKTLVKNILKVFDSAIVYDSGIGVADVREAIAQMYKVQATTVYTFYDVDSMSVQAKNALLKVAEEPPNNAYIIMTVSDLGTVLETIKSRAQIYTMQPYTKDEVDTYYHDYTIDKRSDVREVVNKLCDSPGEVELLCNNNAVELWEYAEKAVDNIASVSGANAFKMAHKIAFKDSDEGFDMLLFMKAFRQICTDRMISALNEHPNSDLFLRYAKGVAIVNSIMKQMGITGINKLALFDIFILDIRKEWM